MAVLKKDEKFSKKMMRTEYGGGPPPGWGAHPSEKSYWEQPRFEKHPLTGKKEAVGGIFHRHWPEHVDVLRTMYENGWPHKDILDVSQELRVREQEDYDNKQQVILQLKQAKAQKMQQDMMVAFTGVPPMDPNMAGMPPGMPPGMLGAPQAMKSLRGDIRMLSGASYEKALEEYKKRFCKNDGVSFGIGNIRKGSLVSDVVFEEYPHDFDYLEPVFDKETMSDHYNVHYKNYYRELKEDLSKTTWKKRKIDEVLYNLNSLPDDIRASVRFNGGGYANHKFWFDLLAPSVKSYKIGFSFLYDIKKEFGSLKELKALFFEVAKGMRSPGWVWLVVDRDGDLLVTKTEQQDSPVMIGDVPVIGVDMWEHSYYRKFGPDKDAYLEAFWSLINWDKASQHYLEATSDEFSKADVPGEPLLTPRLADSRFQQTFTRKPTGITNAASSSVEERDEESTLPDVEEDDLDDDDE